MPNQFCTKCGASIEPDSKFCTACGAETEPAANDGHSTDTRTGGPSISVSAVMSFAGDLMGNTAFAPASGGEMTFTQVMPDAGGMMPNISLSPLKYLLGGVGRLFKGFKGVFKDKRRMIAVILMSVVWLLLIFLPILGINASVIKYLSFLTFAHGGTSGGVIGMMGGVFGKGLFAYFIFALFSGKPFAGVGGGFRSLFGSFAVKNLKTLASILAGTGAALVTCNILTGDSSIQNSMAGVVAFFLSLRALSNKAGFLRGFLASLANKFLKGKTPDTSLINSIIAGWAAGFALSVPLSLTGISIICYLAGVIVIIVAIVLAIVSGLRKGAAVS